MNSSQVTTLNMNVGRNRKPRKAFQQCTMLYSDRSCQLLSTPSDSYNNGENVVEEVQMYEPVDITLVEYPSCYSPAKAIQCAI